MVWDLRVKSMLLRYREEPFRYSDAVGHAAFGAQTWTGM